MSPRSSRTAAPSFPFLGCPGRPRVEFKKIRRKVARWVCNIIDPYREVCPVCGKPAWSNYMVKREVWGELPLHLRKRLIHFWCLEVVLGRALTIGDLAKASINEDFRFAFRMGLAAKKSV